MHYGSPWQTVLVAAWIAAAAALPSQLRGQQPEDASRPADAASRPPQAASRPPQAALGAPVEAPVSGQVWREYDIRSYVRQHGPGQERAIVDWVLRETGTDVWFGDPLGILSVTPEKLRVYHIPEIQSRVQGIVERLTRVGDRSYLSIRLATVSNPNWRTQALRILESHVTQSPGVDAWLLSKEDAAKLIGDLSRRLDYKELSSPSFQIPNGGSRLVSNSRPRSYIRSIKSREGGFGGAELDRASLEEGYALRVSPLLSLDRSQIEAVVKCEIDQVEKLLSVPIDVPTFGGQLQRVQVEVPQLVSWRLHERFRWPAHQVLLLSCGVVAHPETEVKRGPLGLGDGGPLKLLPFGQASPRADALLFLESHPTGADATPNVAAGVLPAASTATIPTRRY